MSDPKRLLDAESDATDRERRLLGAAREAGPPDGLAGATWSALAGLLPVLPTPGPSPGPSPAGGGAGSPGAGGAAGAASPAAVAGGGAAITTAKASGVVAKVIAAKWILAGAVAGTTAVGGYAALSPERPVPPIVQSAVNRDSAQNAQSAPPSHPLRAPWIPAPEAIDTPVPAIAASLPPPASSSPRAVAEAPRPPPSIASAPEPLLPPVLAPPAATLTPSERISHLHEESELVGRARDAMRAGDPGQALALLEQANARFPDGSLVQEREALAIEALWKRGDRVSAAARAETFVRTYPSSPLASRMREFTK